MQPQLWNDLLSLYGINSNTQPSMLIGDFNNILNPSEKTGGDRKTNVHTVNFAEFLKNGGLVSLFALGVPFTWSNGHKANTLIFERLDRVLVNASWLNPFPNATLHNYPIFSSDHSPILLDCYPNNQCNVVGRCDFKFMAMWLNHPEFINIVKKAWSFEFKCNPNDNLRGYLGAMKTFAKVWNQLLAEEATLRNELNRALKNEEILWAQNPRVNWLQLGDKSTKFFQMMTNIRRKKN